MLEEIWVSCHLTDKYEISNLGNVRHSETKRLKNLYETSKGYKNVTLKHRKELNKTCQVHRLVMFAFKSGTYFEGAYVNHIDCNKLNNNIDNLEWCTAKENSTHAINNDLVPRGEKSGTSKLTDNEVIEIRSIYKKGVTQCELSKIYNVDQSLISLVINNKLWTHLTDIQDLNGNTINNKILERMLGQELEPDEVFYFLDNDLNNLKRSNIIILKSSESQKLLNWGEKNKLNNKPITNTRQRSNKPSKEQLQEDMNTLPWTEIGKKYGVSNNGAKKWAKAYDLDISNKPYIVANKNNKPSPNKIYNSPEEKMKAKLKRQKERYATMTDEEKQKRRGRFNSKSNDMNLVES